MRVLHNVPFPTLRPPSAAADTGAEGPEGGPDSRLEVLRGGAGLEGGLEDHLAAWGTGEVGDGFQARGGPVSGAVFLGRDLEGVVAGEGDIGWRVGVVLDLVVASVGTGFHDGPVACGGE